MRPVFVLEAAGDEQTYLKAGYSDLVAHVYYIQGVHSILQNGVDICTSFLPCPLHHAAIGACHIQLFTCFVPFPPIFLPDLNGNYHFSRNFFIQFHFGISMIKTHFRRTQIYRLQL